MKLLLTAKNVRRTKNTSKLKLQLVNNLFLTATEQREQQQLDRLSNQIGALRGAAAQARADSTAAITGAIGGLANIAGSFIGGK